MVRLASSPEKVVHSMHLKLHKKSREETTKRLFQRPEAKSAVVKKRRPLEKSQFRLVAIKTRALSCTDGGKARALCRARIALAGRLKVHKEQSLFWTLEFDF